MKHIKINYIYLIGESLEILTDGIFYNAIHEKVNHYNAMAVAGTPDEMTKLMFEFAGFLEGIRLANIFVTWDFELVN